ncbi:MAG: NADH-dependent [FeFe] hydrogenase, group A6 [Oscillospiraceae bacterium]|nr:NADH-dependent [FeFe] hydrogenase, group A6 [Oscillospiraceae bacterium]
METVNIKINGADYTVPAGITILEAARAANIEIPTLCYMKDINEIGACRICVVEVKGERSMPAACVYAVREGIEITTTNQKIQNSRRTNLELILSTHNKKCLSCVRNQNCELQKLSRDFGIEDEDRFKGVMPESEYDKTAPHMYRDSSKCVLCRRCSAVCEKVQGVGVIGANERGYKTRIGCAFDMGLGEVSCVGCGQCIVACPTGALSENDQTAAVWDAISDPSKHVVVQTAPSIRFAAGESFGMPAGTNVEGRMVSALRRLGFDAVFDTDFGADLTVMEETAEFLDRVQNGGVLPLITSCSPGWIKYCEHNYPELIPNLSSCKSPMAMMGAITKTWYAEKKGIDPKDIFSVAIMPCTAKKLEVSKGSNATDYPDVDVSLTTREFARMVQKAGIDFVNLPDEHFDNPLAESSGAGTIFGATGGVMEAALRTAAELVTGKELENPDFTEVRGTKGIKEAVYKVGEYDVKVAVASGLANAAQILDKVKQDGGGYHMIEIMACPGGCVCGGGQPIRDSAVQSFTDLKTIRAKTVYDDDRNDNLRKSHKNQSIQKLYDEFLEKPGSHKSHKLLHTKHTARSKHEF